ncbi:putative ribonuclease H-like domain-containing protein [Tanacetum coccineum]
MTHPHPNRRFVPQAVLTRSGKINTTSASVNTVVRPVNIASLKTIVNHLRPILNAYKKGYSQVTKPFNKYSANKNSIFNKKVNTVRVKDTTARDRAVVNENKGKGANAVKALACWIQVYNGLDPQKSLILLFYVHGNPKQKEYKEKGIIDSGYSRHMTGNKCYLTEYEDYDGGFNNVLFTDTECLVLSSDFKLLDESQVLLRVPRKDNIYSVDLKSVIPTKGLTCLFAKATIDESNLWHRRLGHINFKNMNKLVRGNLVRGLSSNIFENDHSCVASQKGKQHKASLMNQFCKMKGIKREFSVARTPQQNGVAERRNRTLIKAARTMLVDSKLPTTFWAENPIDRLHETFWVSWDNLGKFNGKADEGFFLLGNGPDWLFDVDSLTISMNYVPVVIGNQTNGPKGSEEYSGMEPIKVDVSGALDKDGEDDQATRSEFERLLQQEKQIVHPNSTNSINTVSTPVSVVGPSFTNDDPSSSVNAAKTYEEHLFEQFSPFKNAFTLPDVPNVFSIDDTGIFGNAYDDEDVEDPSWIEAIQEELLQFQLQKISTLVNLPNGKKAIGTKWVFRNKKDERGIFIRNKARLVAQGYTQEEGIGYNEVFAPVARIEAIRLFFTYASFMGFIMYQMDVKSAFLYGTIEDEVEKALYGLHQAPRAWYETLSTYLIENGFRRGTIDKTLFIKKDKGDILLVQVYVDDIIFGSTKKSLCDEFEGLMHKRFQMSSMGELTFFLGLQVQQKEDGIFISQDKYMAEILNKFDFATVKTTSTPIDINKALVKDEEAEAVDIHLYRSMIGSLMYLIASRPDIMFAVCACARFQVTPKTSHIHAVKRIFRYLKGQPKLGLWYPRDSPFDLEAFLDSDYAGASLDRKSITGGCQFLGKRLTSWQWKKQTIVANSTTKAEYVATANCCGQVLWIQNQMLDYGFNFMNTKIYIDNESTICIVKNPVFHSKTKHMEIRHHFIKDSYKKKLIQVIKIYTDHNVANLLIKAFDTQKPRKAKRTTEISQSSGPIPLITYETVIKEWEDIMERVATTASMLSSRAGEWFEAASKQSNDPPLLRVNTLGSGEDSMKLKELMEFYTKLSIRALDL